MGWVQKIVICAVAIVFLAINANAEDSSHSSGSLQYMEPYATVEGLSVGIHVTPTSEQYKMYLCKPSYQYVNSIWCNFSEIKGGISNSRTILHLTDNIITYINKQLSPAFFTNEEVTAEIARLSRQFNGPAQIHRSPQRSGLPSGVIATWGSIKLQPLIPNDLAILAEGKSPQKGVLADFLINFVELAKAGFPVYSLGGGNGYVWIARFDETGKGKLRFFAADPSQMTQVAQQPDYENETPQPREPDYANKGFQSGNSFSDSSQTSNTKGIPYRLNSTRIRANAIIPVSVGTIATADEICRVLDHPIFNRTISELGALGTINNNLRVDDANLAGKWLFERMHQSGLTLPTERKWNVEFSDLNVIEEQFSECLKRVASTAPSKYAILAKYFLLYLGVGDKYTPKCFEQRYGIERHLGSDGSLIETRVPIGKKARCVDFGYYGYTFDTNYMGSSKFLAMLTLKEAHPGLITILDLAESRLNGDLDSPR